MREIAIAKELLRERLLTKRDKIKDKEEKSEEILRRLTEMHEYHRARSILIYIDKGSEARTKEIIGHALKHKKKVYVPVCFESPYMDFYEISSLEGLVKSRFGVLEPEIESAQTEKEKLAPYTSFTRENTLCITPCIAADKEGHRLGYGKGFYDAFLERKEDMFITVALCYDEMLETVIPSDIFDIKQDIILTESALHRISKRG